MEYFNLGSCFHTYRDLIDKLNEYCAETNTKYWKRDCNLIRSTENSTLEIKDSLVYMYIKFVCVHSGEPSSEIRNSVFEKLNCPAYFKFVLAESGNKLQLIALNNNHNHEVQTNLRQLCPVEDLTKTKRIRVDIIKSDNDSDEDPTECIELLIDDDLESNVNFTFRGLMAPVFTIFNDDMNVNVSDIPNYAKYLLDSGIQGVLVHGTTGEGMSLNVDERKLVTEAWIKAAKVTKQHVMVQVGGAPLPDVQYLAKHAENSGADSLLCLPELYFKPTTSQELINYLRVVSDAAPKTPLLYYHIPIMTNVNINMANFLNDSVGKIPTFHGIKFTSTNLDEGMAAVKANNGKYAVFLGADQLMAGAFTLGFDSAIATSLNIVPQLAIDILQAVEDSNVEIARKIQENLTSICSIITKHGAWVPTMKAAMNILTPINVGRIRAPLENISVLEAEEMKKSLETYLYNKPGEALLKKFCPIVEDHANSIVKAFHTFAISVEAGKYLIF